MPTDKPMQLGMIGLGRMGANIVRRVMRDGQHMSSTTSAPTRSKDWRPKVPPVRRPRQFVGMLDQPRALWLVVPAGIVSRRSTSSASYWKTATS